MSDGEIAGYYRESKDKEKAISILADMNECKKDTVKRIIEEYGYELPGNADADIVTETTVITENNAGEKIKKRQGKEAVQMPAKKIATVSKDKEKALKEIIEENTTGKITVPDSVWAGIVEKRTALIDEREKRRKELEAMERNYELLGRSLEEHEWFLNMLEGSGGMIG